MQFAGVNYAAILTAGVLSWLFGALWYGVLFARRWVAAQGKTVAEERAGRAALPYIVSFIALLVMAWVLAGLIGHLFAADRINARTGALTGAIVWAGFVMSVLATAYAYQQRKLALLIIDGGYWLGVLTLQGLVLGLLKV